MSKFRSLYIEAMWALMVKYGAVVKPGKYDWQKNEPEINYYGGRLEFDQATTLEAAQKLRDHGINYAESQDPASGVGWGFNGTFASGQLRIDYLCGTLVLNDGSSYLWGVMMSDPVSSFGDTVKLLTQEELDLESALETLEERVTIKDEWHFGYICEMGKNYKPFIT